MTDFGYTANVPEGYDEAIIRTRLAMRAEGFSILTEMHVGGLLGAEAGSARQYLVMGVFDTAVANKRLDADLQVAVHMPCNVVVQETESGAIVAVNDPLDVVDSSDPDAQSLALMARDAIRKVLERVEIPI